MTEATWARMGWSARQEWLRASTVLMRQVRAELDALESDERSRLAFLRGVDVARDLLDNAYQDAEVGPERLRAAEQEANERAIS